MPSRIIRAKDRYHHETDWLSTYWHFSFDHYHDPANLSFGPLRVFNDDVVQPSSGFPPHSHADMEIVSYVISGALHHRDDQGHEGIIQAGEVQLMSAGSGTTHAEYNASPSEPVHFLQIWLLPRRRGLTPRWEQRAFPRAARLARLRPVVSPDGRDDTLRIDQDATIAVAAFDTAHELTHDTGAGRRLYLFAIDGDFQIDGDHLSPGDQARITGMPRMNIRAAGAGELLLIDLP